MPTAREVGAAWVARNYWGVDHFQLSQDDFSAWAKALLVCANADGNLAPEERDWVIGLGSAWGWSEDLLEELKNYPADEPIDEVIARSDAARAYGGVALIFCAIAASSADGELGETELQAIKRAARELGIDESVVDEALRIHNEEQGIIRQRIRLTYPPSAHFLAKT